MHARSGIRHRLNEEPALMGWTRQSNVHHSPKAQCRDRVRRVRSRQHHVRMEKESDHLPLDLADRSLQGRLKTRTPSNVIGHLAAVDIVESWNARADLGLDVRRRHPVEDLVGLVGCSLPRRSNIERSKFPSPSVYPLPESG